MAQSILSAGRRLAQGGERRERGVKGIATTRDDRVRELLVARRRARHADGRTRRGRRRAAGWCRRSGPRRRPRRPPARRPRDLRGRPRRRRRGRCRPRARRERRRRRRSISTTISASRRRNSASPSRSKNSAIGMPISLSRAASASSGSSPRCSPAAPAALVFPAAMKPMKTSNSLGASAPPSDSLPVGGERRAARRRCGRRRTSPVGLGEDQRDHCLGHHARGRNDGRVGSLAERLRGLSVSVSTLRSGLVSVEIGFSAPRTTAAHRSSCRPPRRRHDWSRRAGRAPPSRRSRRPTRTRARPATSHASPTDALHAWVRRAHGESAIEAPVPAHM